MLTLDWEFFAVAIPAVIFSGVSKAGFGSGAAFAAASILALVIEPGLALGIMLPLLMLIDVSAIRAYWGRWSARDAKVLVLGSLPGVVAGTLLYRYTGDDVLRLLIGTISLAFVVWQAAVARGWIPRRERPLPGRVGLFTGLIAGFTSFVSHAGGPPVAVYLLSQGMSKTTYQATTVIIFWAINIAKFIPYVFLGIFTAQTMLADLLLAPFALLGAWLGVRAHHLVPERLFFALTYVALTLTGLKLIWDALT